MAHPQPLAGAVKQVRAIAHRLHAAGDDHLSVADANRLGGEHHRLETRTADLVDRQRRDVVREAASKRRLSSRRLPESRGHNVAHDAFLDDGRIDASPSHGFGYDHRAKLRRAEVLQRTEEFAGRSPDAGDDYRFLHDLMLTISRSSARLNALPRSRGVAGRS